MDLTGKVCVVTGAASGIGLALARALYGVGAKVVLSDLSADACQQAATAIVGGTTGTSSDTSTGTVIGRPCDVGEETQIQALIEWVEGELGPIDLFASNAGILTLDSEQTDDAVWRQTLDVNLMSHVWAARHLVPKMIARGGGYLLNTASAAGLLNQPGTASYAVSKHAAVGFAEWLSLTYGDDGIKVSCLCPQAVRTAMIQGFEDSPAAIDGTLEPEAVAQACLDAIGDERFMILPHPQVGAYMAMKAADYDRWLGGMRKLNRHFVRNGALKDL